VSQPTIHIVCSDRHRNGKTLLARVLVDFLLMEGADPFVIDADAPDGPLRAAFPGRTALVDLEDIRGQMKLFDTILASPGRDYVIDLPAAATPRFCEAASELNFMDETRKFGFASILFFVVDKDPESVTAARNVETILKPDLLVPVRNASLGSAWRAAPTELVIDMPVLDKAIPAITEDKRFSFRTFMLGEETAVPPALRQNLRAFLARLTTDFRDLGPALSFRTLAQHARR
jgi:hypothetical protein